MRSLFFWAGVKGAPPREPGTEVVLWREECRGPLERAGIPFRTLDDYLDAEARDAIDEAAIAWTKAWGKRPMLDGKSFRELVVWKGVPLWWFAEIFLHYSTAAPRRVRTIDRFQRILDAARPDEVEAFGLTAEDALLLERTCTVRGVLFHGRPGVPSVRAALRTLATSLESRLNTAKMLLTAVKAALAGRPPRPRGDRKPVLFLSHAAFWRERQEASGERHEYEHYFDRLIPELAQDEALAPFTVAVGPRRAFRRRGTLDRLSEWLRLRSEGGPYVHVNRYTRSRVVREVFRATRDIRGMWRLLRRSPAVSEAFSCKGVPFADLAGPDLAGTMLLQLPWAVRCYEEMASVLEDLQPAAVCLYAESTGWGRAVVAACRAARVPTVAVQHGIIYARYYSYTYADDEADAPRPDRTAVFGEAARRILVERGGYAPESLIVTGSPKFDDLLRATESWDRTALRSRLGVASGEKLLLVASRYRPIRETHQSIGSVFAAFVRAVESLDGVLCIVKPHPAEPPDAYDRDLRATRATRVRVLAPSADLFELLHASDALVTVESLSAVEALVLGRPVLVLNTPTNLRAMVEQGVVLGVPASEDPFPALKRLLFDPATREALGSARARYLGDVARGVDGRATARILNLLRETALGRDSVLA